MKKMLLILTAPFLLVDACSSARLTKKDTGNDKVVIDLTTIKNDPATISQSNSDDRKQIVVRELSNGEFDLSTRFTPEIKDHYRKGIIQLKVTPEQ